MMAVLSRRVFFMEGCPMSWNSEVDRFKERFHGEVHGVIDDVVQRIMAFGRGTAHYLTPSGYWLGFQVTPKEPMRRRKPFVQLVTPHKGVRGNTTVRIFLTTPPRGRNYVDPHHLLEFSGTYGGQLHVTASRGTDLGPVMALVGQSYHFRELKKRN